MESKSSKDDAEKDNKTEKKESICDRRIMDLKEAEKTIANKDVIIRMLQEQVKKLEAAYKENLKETESFRYQFYLASEQIKRLRACPQNADKIEENQIKELKCDLAKWKHKCDQLTSCKESSVFSEKCRYVQQIQDIERIMNSHYDLLQTLVEKILEKNPKHELGPDKVEDVQKKYEEQIGKLQDEIARLKEENSKLQSKKVSEDLIDVGHLVTAKDSLLETYKRSQANLQKKVSSLLSRERMGDEDSLLGDDLKERKVSFSEPSLGLAQNDTSISTDVENDSKLIEKADEISVEIVASENEQEDKTTQTTSRPTTQLRNLENLVLGEEVTICNSNSCRMQCFKVEKPDTKSSNTEETRTDTNDIVEPPIENGKGNKKELRTEEVNEEGLPNSENNTSEAGGEAPKSEDNNDTTTNDTTMDVNIKTRKKESCHCLTATSPQCGCVPPRKVPEAEATDALGDIANVTPQLRKLSEENDQTNNAQTNEVQEMVEKLNAIGDRVAEVLEKQVYTCKELDLLKTELAGSRDTTETCSTNITKLSARIDEQKLTFLQKFQEHQQVTDNLMLVNGEITKELSDLKAKIEALFKNIDELNQNRKLTDPSDDVITIDECRNEIDKVKEEIIAKKSAERPPQIGGAAKEEENCICYDEKKEETDSLAADDMDALEAKYVTLEAQNRQKDQQIKCIDALISYYRKAHENVVAINAQAAEKIQNQLKEKQPPTEEELEKYIEKARSENLKLKHTISSVIDCLTVKVSELKGSLQPTSSLCLCVKNVVSDFNVEQFECEMCCVESSSVNENTMKVTTKLKTQLELEDIYQAVKRTVIHNCRGCACSPIHTVSDTCTCYSNMSSDQDSYSCVYCACSSEPKILNKKESSKSDKNKKLAVGGAEDPRSAVQDAMVTNLETYIQYLHEQLHIITSIENRIEELRVHMKSSQV